MLVTRILGACPSCGGDNQFGNVSVRGDHVLRGCMNCKYKETVWLPKIRKRIVYVDQFFFSGAFRGGDSRFVEAAQRVRQLSELQLLVAPFSSIHEDETHQWGGYGGKCKDDLLEFIKATSRGHEFNPYYQVNESQIISAFQAFLAGSAALIETEEHDAIEGEVHEWDDYFRIDVGRYIEDINLLRNLKHKSVEGLVNLFESWRESSNTFDQDVTFELRASGESYIESYIEFAARMLCGDSSALLDSPVSSQVVQSMLHCFSEDIPQEERMKQTASFFLSEHFAQIPSEWLSARIFATLKDMVKRGSFTNREKALKKLSGFFYDVEHISTYAPYCDAFIMDQPMAALVADPRIGLEDKYNVKIFSLNNWSALFAWFDAIEAGMTLEHKAGLSAAYPASN